MKNKYYFTFGTSEYFPFKNGCVVVEAGTRSEAIDKFNAKYPPRKGSILVNCAFIYDQEEWSESLKSVEKIGGKSGVYIMSYVHDMISD